MSKFDDKLDIGDRDLFPKKATCPCCKEEFN